MPYKDPNDPRRKAAAAGYTARYRATPIGKSRLAARALMHLYGLDRQQAEIALVSQQGDLCRSCGKFARLDVDHDHTTGAARGMICRGCNTIAGALENPKRPIVQAYLDTSK